MQPEIKRLVELQAVDSEVTRLRARLNAFPQQLAEIDKRLAEGKQHLAASKESLTASLKDRKKYEMDVDAWKEKAKKYREQSFTVKTNEAYKALQHEMAHAEGEVAQAEDRLLARMVDGETFDRDVKSAEQALKELERAAGADRQKLQVEQAVLQKQLEAKQAERGQLLPNIPEELLATYDRVAVRHQGIGVAAVLNQACSLCGLRVVPHVFQLLRRDNYNEIFQCETCSRILYYVEPPPAGAAAAAAGAPAASADATTAADAATQDG
jgi:predicted  nucleic acid-binding Zn-ribbon protein